MRLRVIDGGVRSPGGSQALWHGIAASLRPGDDPALVFVTPATPYVCLGYHQSAEAELDEAACRAHGVAVLRRRLGGGAVLLDGRQLIFHFIWPRARAAGPAEALFARFLAPLVAAYRRLGIDAAFRPVNDVQVGGRKLAGAAAAEIGAAIVVGSMVLFAFDGALMARLLRVPAAKMRDKLAVALADYVTSLDRLLAAPPDRAAMLGLLVEAAAEALGVRPAAAVPDARECAAIAAEAARLADPAWTPRRAVRHVAGGVKLAAGVTLAEGLHKAPGGLVRARLLEQDGHIADLDLEGDFACLRPEAFDALARRLVGATLDRGLQDAIAGGLAGLGMDLPGVSAADLATAIRAARRDGC